MIERTKKAAAYHVSLSAVKKIQKEKRGIEKKRQSIPQKTASLGLRFKISKTKTTKKAISCIFIFDLL